MGFFGKDPLPRTRTSPLCQKCQRIFHKSRWKPLHPAEQIEVCNPTQLIDSAKFCPSCYLFLRSNLARGFNDQVQEDRSRLRYQVWHMDMIPYGVCEIVLQPATQHQLVHPRNVNEYKVIYRAYDGRQTSQYMLRHLEGINHVSLVYTGSLPGRRTDHTPEHDAQDELFVAKLAHTTDNPQTRQRAREWIESCIGSVAASEFFPSAGQHTAHVLCTQASRIKRVPSRLIRILGDQLVRLCYTKDIPEYDRISYVALSHCWGRRRTSLMTTSSNEAHMLTEIPFLALDRTFQHVIMICQRLGFGYLWIDSLCILQGNSEDFHKEASRMGSIYSHCALNIVASSAVDGSGGCFFDRDHSKISEFSIECCPSRRFRPGVETATVYASLQTGLPENGMATSERAWCFQETFLAPRSLYFQRDRLYWQCRSHCADEVFPSGLFSEIPLRCLATGNWESSLANAVLHTTLGIAPGTIKSRTGSKYQNRQLGRLAWMTLVERYSGGQLTFWRDRLLAISGVARLLYTEYEHMDHELEKTNLVQHYLAGLWQRDLSMQLLWSANAPAYRPKPAYAPSWSWSSLRGRVTFERSIWSDTQTNFEVLKAQTRLSTDDPYGPVEDGSILLRCRPLIQRGFRHSREDGQYRLLHEGGMILSSKIKLDESFFWCPTIHLLDGWQTVTDLGTVDEYTTRYGLLLVPCTPSDHPTTGVQTSFRRVGTYSIGSSTKSVIIINDDFDMIKTVPTSDCLPLKHDEDQIVINIV